MVASSPTEIRAVIFDMDGLLLDTEVLALRAFRETCHGIGVDYDESLYIGCLGLNRIDGERYFRNALESFTDVDIFIAHWTERYQAIKRKESPALKPGVLNLLGVLYEKNLPAAVATSSSINTAESLLSGAGIHDRFKTIVAGDQVARGKPDPDIYLEAARRLSVNEAYCLALEDSDNGVRSAVAAGMVVMQVPDLAEPMHGLGYRVKQKSSLLEVIDELSPAQ